MRLVGLNIVGGGSGGGGGGGGAPPSMIFGGNLAVLGQNWRKGTGASTDAGDTAVSQLTAWVPPMEVTLTDLEITSFIKVFGTDPVVEIFLGASGTPIASVTYDTPIDFPLTGSHQTFSLPDVVVPANSELTVRQISGTRLEFSAVTIYYR